MSGIATSLAEQAVFVYGEFDFVRPLKDPMRPLSLRDLMPRQEPPIAIEILREFGPQEFIGKVYLLRESAWRPVTPEGASSFDWYQSFQKGEAVYFDMRGSGRWGVEWFRFESSVRSPNPYLAVALKQTKAEAEQKLSAIPGS